MADLAIKAVVTNPDGSLFYREEHEWTNLDPQMMTWFADKMVKLETQAKESAGKKEDGANLSAILSSTVDGRAQQSVILAGVSYHALTKFQRAAHNVADELLKLGEEKAKHKK